MATIKDVAKMANVSTATVSRIINNKPGANIETEKYGLFKLGMIKAIKFEVLFDKDLAMLFGS